MNKTLERTQDFLRIAISRAQVWFESISARERLMLISLVFVLLLIWASVLSDTYKVHSKSYSDAKKEVETQKIWLEKKDSINNRLDDALVGRDAANAFDAIGTKGRIDLWSEFC